MSTYRNNLEYNRAKFWDILTDTIPESGYEPPQGPVTILNVACGWCEEGPVLNAFFGSGELGVYSDRVHLVGIDIRANRIEWAQEDHQGLPGSYQFVIGDAQQLDQSPEIPSQADVVVFRRQNIGFGDPQEWPAMFRRGIARLKPSGIMICTSLSSQEHELMLKAMKAIAESRLIIDKYTRYAPKILEERKPSGVIAIDHRIAIFGRHT